MSTLQAYRLTKMLERVLAALETPGDLSAEEKQHVLEDGAACIEQWGCQEKPEPAGNGLPPFVVGHSGGWIMRIVTAEVADGFLHLDSNAKDATEDPNLAIPFTMTPVEGEKQDYNRFHLSHALIRLGNTYLSTHASGFMWHVDRVVFKGWTERPYNTDFAPFQVSATEACPPESDRPESDHVHE